ncbi:MAG: hypothetical protein K2X93_24665, partial [Candidatus Obscuribacterales bacterium]|nr:hypothetical protein [Candidatus Obscuribacterales bacterium]
RVLAVDDQHTNRVILARQLESQDMIVKSAASAREALVDLAIKHRFPGEVKPLRRLLNLLSHQQWWRALTRT